MKIYLLSIILLCAVVGISAQSKTGFRIETPKEIKEQSQLINDAALKELTDLLGDPDLYCKKAVHSAAGTINKIYLNNEGNTLSAFEFRDAKNKRFSINLNNDPLGSVGKYSIETIKGVLKEKRKVNVSYVECREQPSSGIMNYAVKITVE